MLLTITHCYATHLHNCLLQKRRRLGSQSDRSSFDKVQTDLHQHRKFPCFSMGIFHHVMCLGRSHVSENFDIFFFLCEHSCRDVAGGLWIVGCYQEVPFSVIKPYQVIVIINSGFQLILLQVVTIVDITHTQGW